MSDFLDAGRHFLSQNLRLFFSEREFFNSYSPLHQLTSGQPISQFVGSKQNAPKLFRVMGRQSNSPPPSLLNREATLLSKC
jgi:hypothetical protein